MGVQTLQLIYFVKWVTCGPEAGTGLATEFEDRELRESIRAKQ